MEVEVKDEMSLPDKVRGNLAEEMVLGQHK